MIDEFDGSIVNKIDVFFNDSFVNRVSLFFSYNNSRLTQKNGNNKSKCKVYFIDLKKINYSINFKNQERENLILSVWPNCKHLSTIDPACLATSVRGNCHLFYS